MVQIWARQLSATRLEPRCLPVKKKKKSDQFYTNSVMLYV